MPRDLLYIVLIFGLFVLPKILQRIGLPGAVTSLALGFLTSAFGLLPDDPTVGLLSTFGIVALFLWAGLEIHLDDLRPEWRVLTLNLLGFSLVLAGASWIAWRFLELDARAATILGLALVTPSTGFILDSIGGFGLGRPEIRRVRAVAIATEILALLALFAVTQSSSWPRFAGSSLALVALIVAIPPALKVFARHIEPYAPRTEFAFLLMVAVVCAYATRKLGVYYLVGAFIVGLSARRFRDQLPAMSSDRLLNTVEEFAMVFGPFYFFHAGQELHPSLFDLPSLGLGVGLALVLIPLRGFLGAALQPGRGGWTRRERLRIGTALLPTLVFSIVLLGILRERFELGSPLVGGLFVYTLIDTTLPGYVLRGFLRTPCASPAGLPGAIATAPDTAADPHPAPAGLAVVAEERGARTRQG